MNPKPFARKALLLGITSAAWVTAHAASPPPAKPHPVPTQPAPAADPWLLEGFEPEPLPPTAPGREVLFDSRSMAADRARQLRLSDLDPEAGEIIREINRKPGTWQAYLLYTAEDLPDKLFHPGFAIRFPPRVRRPLPPVTEPAPGETPTPPAGEAASSPSRRPLPR